MTKLAQLQACFRYTCDGNLRFTAAMKLDSNIFPTVDGRARSCQRLFELAGRVEVLTKTPPAVLAKTIKPCIGAIKHSYCVCTVPGAKTQARYSDEREQYSTLISSAAAHNAPLKPPCLELLLRRACQVGRAIAICAGLSPACQTVAHD